MNIDIKGKVAVLNVTEVTKEGYIPTPEQTSLLNAVRASGGDTITFIDMVPCLADFGVYTGTMTGIVVHKEQMFLENLRVIADDNKALRKRIQLNSKADESAGSDELLKTLTADRLQFDIGYDVFRLHAHHKKNDLETFTHILSKTIAASEAYHRLKTEICNLAVARKKHYEALKTDRLRADALKANAHEAVRREFCASEDFRTTFDVTMGSAKKSNADAPKLDDNAFGVITISIEGYMLHAPNDIVITELEYTPPLD